MFRLFFLLVSVCLCVDLAFSAPAEPIPIISEEIVVENDGKFHYSYESGDGTKVHEEGEVKAIDKDHAIETVQGGWEYSAPDGQKIAVQYVADENGYQPTGDSIPKVPEQIARALKYIEAHPPAKEHAVSAAVAKP